MSDQIAQGFRLSPLQKRLWLLQGGSQPDPAYRSVCTLRLEGGLDEAALERALARVAAGHEILRTAFPVLPWTTLPLQEIQEAGRVPLERVAQASLDELFAAALAAPLDLEHGRALRASLAPLGPREHALLLTLPALCGDPASLRILAHALVRAYAAERGQGTGPETPMQYADIAEWHNQLLESEETAEGLERWREEWRTRDVPGLLAARLPLEEKPAGPVPFAPAVVEVPLALDGAAERSLADQGTPVRAFLLACWQALLARSTGAPEVLTGVLHDGRRYEELREAVGPLASCVPVLSRMDSGTSFREIAAQARAADDEAARRQEIFSWEHVAGEPSEPGFFPACFSFEEPWEETAAGLCFRRDRHRGWVDRFKLCLTGERTAEGLRLSLAYDPSHFRRETAEILAERLAILVRSAAERPDAPLADLDLVGDRELGRLRELATTAAPAPEETLHRRLEAQAGRTPDRAAVVDASLELTYAELEARANQLAHHLRSLGIGLETPVAICLDRSPEMLVAIFGILKAGGAWVPLDPGQPAERLAFILGDTGTPLVLTRDGMADLLPAGRARVLCLDAEAEAIAACPSTRPDGGAGPRDLAYIIYTSGSTGTPKGVAVEHRSPLNLLAGLEAAALVHHGSPLRASLNAPLFFDASVQQIVLLLAGHTLHVIPEEVRTDGHALLRFLADRAVQLFDCTPSQLRMLLAAGLLEAPGPVPEVVWTAGEAIDEGMWQRLRASARTAFYNIYGPTECTVDATAHRIGSGAATPTIGRPLAGYEIHLLDRALRLVPLGAPGELCVGGPGLARGYAGRPDTTAAAFVPHSAGQPGERLYRTGDLARHRPDGELEFLGRIDYQVKVRGYRIEPGEVEAALAAHPWVRDAVVDARQEGADLARLVAWFLPSLEAPADLAGAHGELQRFLYERLPVYMVPSAFVPLSSFPFTRTGKVDRRALPAPDPVRPGLGADYAAPRNAVEETLAEVWAETLGLAGVGIDDSFFSLGGDSIRSLQALALAREKGLDFSVQQLFQHQTIRELAAVIGHGGDGATAAAPAPRTQPFGLISAADRARLPEGIEDAYPITRLQTGMIYHTEMDRESGIYQDIFSFTLRARLDLPALEAAVQTVLDRHPVLRTSFALTGYSEPLQLVHGHVRVPVVVEDLRTVPAERQPAAIASFIEAEKVAPFHWARPPLFRIHVHLLDKERFRFTMTEHHSILDGWSMATLLTELFNRYFGRPEEEAPSRSSFREYVALEQQALASEESRSYWRRTLDGVTAARLPRLPEGAGGTGPLRQRTIEFMVPDSVAEKLRAVATAESLPLKSLALAAHMRVISLLTGQTDVVTGAPFDGRPEEAGAERVLGIYVAMLPFRLRLRGGSWVDLARDVFTAELEMMPHRRFPMAEALRLANAEMDLETSFNFLHFHVYRNLEQESGANVENGQAIELLNVPFTALFHVDPFTARIGFGLNFHVNVLSEEQVRAIAGCYQAALASMADEPRRPHDTVSLLPEDERRWLLSGSNELANPPLAAGERSVAALFSEQARRIPDALALVCEDERLTFRELERRANQLASHLQAYGVSPEVRVAILLPRSVEAIVAILAVLKAGGAYLPLDPTQPFERLLYMIEDSGASILVTDSVGADRIPFQLAFLPIVSLDTDAPLIATSSDAPPAVDPLPESLAYIIYTSGSTGRPKGTLVSHRGLPNLAASLARGFDIRPGDRLLQFSSLTFDASVAEILPTFLIGAELHLPEAGRMTAGADLIALLQERRITHATIPPSVLAGLPTAELPDLRVLVVAGEACLPEVAERWVRGRRLIDAYGPTEASVCATIGEVPGDGSKPRIGRPIPGARAMVVDAHGEPAPVGVPGELWIGGIGLARGYLNRPDATAATFVPDPFASSWGAPGARLYRTGDLARRLPDGQLDYLGRIDHQVKVRGFRIELGEIEARLLEHRSVRAAAAVVREVPPGDRRIMAYVVLAGTDDTEAEAPAAELAPETASTLRDHLREMLPDFMLPAAFIRLRALPLTAHGKLDRRALPGPADVARSGESSYVAPRNPTEEQLAAIWAEILGLEKVSVFDEFLSLGGHSLLAIDLISRVRAAFEVDLPLPLLFKAATVADLAVEIVRAQAEQISDGALARLLAEMDEISDEEAQGLLASQKEQNDHE